MQFWPRKRTRHSLVRVRSWAVEKTAKPLGFIGYKAGMTYVLANDNRPKSTTKGDKIQLASTIIECPPMIVVGISFYKFSKKLSSILSQKLPKELAKKIQFPKKTVKKFDDITDYDDVRLLVVSQPKLAETGSKKPKILEIAIGGNKDDKIAYAKEILGKEIAISDVLEGVSAVDIRGVSKGKGFQGTVKRYGVPIRQHKSEKTKRGIGNLGAWTPKRVDYRVPQPGKMGYHQRTEYNKHILKIGDKGEDVTPKGGFTKYGLVKNTYVMLKGSVIGPRNRAVLMSRTIRPTKTKLDAFDVTFIKT